jgi:hypothetical protein
VGASRCDHGIPLRGPPHDRGLGPVSSPACPCWPRRCANASPARMAPRFPVLTEWRRRCVAFAPGSMVPRIPCPARAACSTTWSPSVRYPLAVCTANAIVHRAGACVVEQCAMCPFDTILGCFMRKQIMQTTRTHLLAVFQAVPTAPPTGALWTGDHCDLAHTHTCNRPLQ